MKMNERPTRLVRYARCSCMPGKQPAPATRGGADKGGNSVAAEQVAQFRDVGCTGMSINRPQLRSLLKQLNAISAVVVDDITRLSRRTSQVMDLIDVFEKSGARVVTADSPEHGALDSDPNDC